MIAVGLAFGFMLGYVAHGAVPTNQTLAAEELVIQNVEMIDSTKYQNKLNFYLENYSRSDDASQVYNEILQLSAPQEFKELHLQLVLTFGKIINGDQSAFTSLQNLKNTYNWLSL